MKLLDRKFIKNGRIQTAQEWLDDMGGIEVLVGRPLLGAPTPELIESLLLEDGIHPHDTRTVYEIYTKNPDDLTMGGWEIKFVRTDKDIKTFPLFDCVITRNDCNQPSLIIDF